jgi:long-chain acyl-CoA synthetase
MSVQNTVAEGWQKLTGRILYVGYGLTETSPAISITPLNQKTFNESIGLPIPSTDVQIRDEHHKVLDLNQEGEIWVKGPQVMKGYWKRPDETAKVLDQDGWLCTGDMGKIDDKGFLYLLDRKKDMIKVSGFNVYPNEIEDVVAKCSGVSEVAAIGVPDEHSGEVIKLFVVKKDPRLTEESIRKCCHDNLTGYKRPKQIEFRDRLPKSNVGKILRRQLRDEELAKHNTK